MNSRTLAVSILCLLPLASCAGGDPKNLTDEGAKALNSGDYEAAAKSFDKALAELGGDTTHPDWLRAKMGAIQARTQTDATKAKNEFLELARASPSKVTPDHFNLIGSRLGNAGHLTEANDVLEAGMAMHPESPHLKTLLVELGKKAESSGDAAVLEKLKGLGYVGGD
jgi:hypothetical protein